MKKTILSSIRSIIINTLVTTALTVLFMCLAAVFQGFTLWGVTVPFEMLLVNFLFHLGSVFLQKIDFKNQIILYIIMAVYLTGLIIGFGTLFNWFHANAIWVICLVALIVLIVAIFIDALKVNREAAIINKRLEELRLKDKNDEE